MRSPMQMSACSFRVCDESGVLTSSLFMVVDVVWCSRQAGGVKQQLTTIPHTSQRRRSSCSLRKSVSHTLKASRSWLLPKPRSSNSKLFESIWVSGLDVFREPRASYSLSHFGGVDVFKPCSCFCSQNMFRQWLFESNWVSGFGVF